MIICDKQINGIRYAIWQLTESVSELKALIDGRFLVSLDNISNETRQKERLASRLLIETLCNGYQAVDYKENGEPYFTQTNLYLSISHTKSYVAVAVAPFRIGIDIEHTSDRVLRITEKFLNTTELAQLASHTNQASTALLYWCAKEALYKKLTEKEPEFTLFTCEQQKNLLNVHYQAETYTFSFEQNNNYTLVLG